jgi:hypothetical protein
MEFAYQKHILLSGINLSSGVIIFRAELSEWLCVTFGEVEFKRMASKFISEAAHKSYMEFASQKIHFFGA